MEFGENSKNNLIYKFNMKYLKYYTDVNESIVSDALKNLKKYLINKWYLIKNYEINSDGFIDVNGDVNLLNYDISKLPLKFNSVSGSFRCHGGHTTSLVGTKYIGPKYVGEHFNCSSNELTSLEGSPKSVGGDFNCSINRLINLIGSPETINGHFNCVDNPNLISLEGCTRGCKNYYFEYCYKLPELIRKNMFHIKAIINNQDDFDIWFKHEFRPETFKYMLETLEKEKLIEGENYI